MAWVDKSATLAAVKDTLSPKNGPGSFILVGYKDDNTLLVQHRGNGGVAELLSQLKDNEVQYALIRIGDVKDGNPVARDVLLSWFGPAVSKIKSAKKKTHQGEIMATLQPNHGQLECLGRREFTEDIIRERSGPGSGSHVIE